MFATSMGMQGETDRFMCLFIYPNMMGQMQKHMNLSVQPCMPIDVANVLLFLASDESRAITGQVIVTDFGATL